MYNMYILKERFNCNFAAYNININNIIFFCFCILNMYVYVYMCVYFLF